MIGQVKKMRKTRKRALLFVLVPLFILVVPSTHGQGPAAPSGSLQKNNSGSFGATNVTENGTNLAIGDDAQFKGPNPVIDARAYGVRGVVSNATPAIPGITASITGTSATLSTSTCSSQTGSVCFVNGDGIVIYGAGPTNTMTTPAAPTVTPSLTAGLTGSLLDVASPGGSTTYSYKITACDLLRGCTAASAVGTRQVGLPRLVSKRFRFRQSVTQIAQQMV